ncbi:MAG TPA: tripartite tricarboxylate transporter substrate binding protein [Thermodesulfobacteriota bacterium]|nr:tripartite tricarboxylate transporter substrate binding protein [Thermodesulfobacteriota bacterium]
MQARFRYSVMAALVVFSVACALAPQADAQGKYPSRPITVICPYGAGGASDTLGRMVSMLIEKDLGQPVNVVNRTGGSGAVGYTAGATATPDGYTLCVVSTDLTTLHWMGMATVDNKAVKAIGMYGFIPAGVIVRASAPWKNLKELQDYIKANPGKLKASGAGKGGIWDLCRAAWLKAAGIPIDALPWVPSNGAAPALQELVADGVQVATCSLTEGRSLIEANKVRGLAIMDDKRAEVFPSVPTLKELGLNWTDGSLLGIVAPKGTPAEVISILEKAVQKAAASDPLKKFMKENAFVLQYRNAADFDAFMAKENETKGVLMKEAGIVK